MEQEQRSAIRSAMCWLTGSYPWLVWPSSTSRGVVHTVSFAPPRGHTAARAHPRHVPRGDHMRHPGGVPTRLHVDDLDAFQSQQGAGEMTIGRGLPG